MKIISKYPTWFSHDEMRTLIGKITAGCAKNLRFFLHKRHPVLSFTIGEAEEKVRKNVRRKYP